LDESRKHLISTLGMLLGLGLFLWAGLQMSRKIEPYWTWFYCFAWWSFILFSQSLLHRRGARSLLFEQPGRFFLLAFFSISLWLVFEVWNFRLNNWEYHNVPGQITVRWLGYAISFATVVPGLLTMEHLLDHFGVFGSLQTAGRAPDERFDGCLFWTGAIFLLFPLIWPRFFFLLSGGDLFCCWSPSITVWERRRFSANGRKDLFAPSISSWRREWYAVSSGSCGISGREPSGSTPFPMWDGSRSLRCLSLGFLGFPPFAVECYVMTSSFLVLCRRIGEEGLGQGRFRLRFLLGAGMVAWDLLIFHGIDLFTVASFSR